MAADWVECSPHATCSTVENIFRDWRGKPHSHFGRSRRDLQYLAFNATPNRPSRLLRSYRALRLCSCLTIHDDQHVLTSTIDNGMASPYSLVPTNRFSSTDMRSLESAFRGTLASILFSSSITEDFAITTIYDDFADELAHGQTTCTFLWGCYCIAVLATCRSPKMGPDKYHIQY